MKGFGLIVRECEECKKQVCAECFKIKNGVLYCQDCWPRAVAKFKKQIMEMKGDICPACGAKGSLEVVNLTIFRNRDKDLSWGEIKYIGPIMYKYLVKCNRCSFPYDSEHMEILVAAQKAERAGRYDDAARLYEGLDLLDKARSMRELNRTGTVKSVNLNTLIEQLRSGGLVVPYKCPNCGGTIKIDKDYNQGMKLCAYCGSPIDTTLIASILGNL